MPYDMLRVAGDGDCFFSSVGVHLKILSGAQIPLDWFTVDSGNHAPPYHGFYVGAGRQVREGIADWLAQKLLGTSLTVITSLWDSVVSPLEFKNIGAALNAPDFSSVPEVSWLAHVPDALADRYRASKTDAQRSCWISLYVYWYQRSYRWIEYSSQWAELCRLLELPKLCIWGHFDTTQAHAQGKTAGFAAAAVQEYFGLTLVPVATNVDIWSLIVHDQNAWYIRNDAAHFNPLVWRQDVLSISLTQHKSEMEIDNGPVSTTTTTSQAASRSLRNTVRDPFILGLAVWNVNHLGEKPPEPKRTSAKNKPDTSSLIMETKRKRTSRFNIADLYEDENEDEDESESEDDEEDAYIDFDVKAFTKKDKAFEKEEMKFEKVQKAHDDTKNQQKLKAIGDLFDKQGRWMDLLALNEINLGVGRIEDQANGRYKVYRGPRMIAVGGQRLSTQKEYYPLLINLKRTDYTIEHKGCIAVRADGTFKNVAENELYPWIKSGSAARRESNKSQLIGADELSKQLRKMDQAENRWWDQLPNHRPVIVHRLEVDKVKVNVAIIHTTPGGTEFERSMVYAQLREFFRNAKNGRYDAGKGDLWLIAGDFYLYSESLVIPTEEEFKWSALMQDVQRNVFDQCLKELPQTASKLKEAIVSLGKTLAAQLKERLADKTFFPDLGQNPKLGISAEDYKEAADYWIDRLKKAAKRIEAACEGLGKPPTDYWKKFEMIRETIAFLAHPRGIWWQANKFAAEMDQKFEALKSADVEMQEDIGTMGTHSTSATPSKVKPQKLEMKEEQPQKGEGGMKRREPEGSSDDVHEDEDEDEEDELLEGDSYFLRTSTIGRQVMQVLRNVSGATFQAALGDSYRIFQPVWGTNIHVQAKPIDVTNPANPKTTSLRLADFIISSTQCQSAFVGLVHHEKEGILRVDDDNVSTTCAWRAISDHFPVGGLFSLRSDDLRVHHIVIEDLADQKKQMRGFLHVLTAYHYLRTRFQAFPDLDEKIAAKFKSTDSRLKEKAAPVLDTHADTFSMIVHTIAEWLFKAAPSAEELAKRIFGLNLGTDEETVFQTLCELTAMFR